MMTMITEVFGVRGEAGDLVISPRLMAEQFDESHTASISLRFADKAFRVVLHNPQGREYGDYAVHSANCDGVALTIAEGKAMMPKGAVDALGQQTHTITIELK